MKNMMRKSIAVLIFIWVSVAILSACGSYKPPYQRGYDEGYEAGYEAAGGEASPAAEDKKDAEGAGTEEETQPAEKRGLSNIISKKEKKEEETEAAGEEEKADDNDAPAETVNEETPAQDTAADDTAPEPAPEAEAAADDQGGSEVLGEGSEPAEGQGGSAGIPEGRIITADAVNEALYSHPEVIDGLRQIYPDTAIFGEYVGESETNLLHKVNGPHFGELTYNTIVVFDGSKSLDQILAEGFFTKCSCCDQ